MSLSGHMGRYCSKKSPVECSEAEHDIKKQSKAKQNPKNQKRRNSLEMRTESSERSRS